MMTAVHLQNSIHRLHRLNLLMRGASSRNADHAPPSWNEVYIRMSDQTSREKMCVCVIKEYPGFARKEVNTIKDKNGENM